MPRTAALLLLATLALGACGDEPQRSPRPEPEVAEAPPPSTPMPSEPEDALDWVRAAHSSRDPAELRRRLDAWPLEDEDFLDTEETQVILTWRIRTALQDGDIEGARDQWKLLIRHFDGHGVSPEGRGLTPDMIRLGLVDEARLLTRRRIEGAKPDAAGASSAWKTGADLLQPEDTDDSDRLERARRWAEWSTFERWLRALALEAGRDLGEPDAARPDATPFVIVVSDDFALGESIFQNVLERWLREGQEVGLRGVLVPIVRGQVRMGMRRVPAERPEDEVASLKASAQETGLRLLDDPTAGLVKSAVLADGTRLAKAFGLEGQEVAVLIVDRRGRIVGRISGMGPDLRALDPVIQKLVSR